MRSHRGLVLGLLALGTLNASRHLRGPKSDSSWEDLLGSYSAKPIKRLKAFENDDIDGKKGHLHNCQPVPNIKMPKIDLKDFEGETSSLQKLGSGLVGSVYRNTKSFGSDVASVALKTSPVAQETYPQLWQDEKNGAFLIAQAGVRHAVDVYGTCLLQLDNAQSYEVIVMEDVSDRSPEVCDIKEHVCNQAWEFVFDMKHAGLKDSDKIVKSGVFHNVVCLKKISKTSISDQETENIFAKFIDFGMVETGWAGIMENKILSDCQKAFPGMNFMV